MPCVAIDRTGNLLIADTGNHRIRMVSGDGIISTVAGADSPGFSGDGGPANYARLVRPAMPISDAAQRRVRRTLTESMVPAVMPSREGSAR